MSYHSYKPNYSKQLTPFTEPTYRMAKVPHMFDSVRVVVGSDEDIFEETYMTCLIGENRAVKFKKSVLEFV